jgi:phospholipid/cholesterol/gamma-HCH transport system permease protein
MSQASVEPEPRRRFAAIGSALGIPVRGFFGYFGDHAMMLGQAFLWLFRPPFRLRLFLDQMEFIGVGSLPIIGLVGLFSGMVSAQQTIRALSLFGQERYVGATVGLSLALELAPVFTALMVTARAGSGMATELGSMRITEQIDALSTFAVNPIQYLITPRILASIVMMPVMTMVFNVVGLIGAFFYSIYVKHVDLGSFLEHFRYLTDPSDYLQGGIKAAVFGAALSLAACYQGFNVRGGAKEVGLATTRAVVAGSVSVLVLDFFVSDMLAAFFPFQS